MAVLTYTALYLQFCHICRLWTLFTVHNLILYCISLFKNLEALHIQC